MQNLVRATGRTVWYLNDPIEDNPRHDWADYRGNWESTLTASLLQPDVWRFEVAPWPERIFGGKYPRNAPREQRQRIPPAYASELQVVTQALNDMNQRNIEWDCGTRGIGVLISDSMMFQREKPTPSDPNMAQFYGLALPLLKRGMPITPVQLENVPLPNFLDEQRVLLLTYQGQKPLTAEVHSALAGWVRSGGVLVMVDDDKDPYNRVREWWNDDGKTQRVPRQHLFEQLGVDGMQFSSDSPVLVNVGKGAVMWVRQSPVPFALSAEAEARLVLFIQQAARKAGLKWKETNFLALRRGPYVIGAGLDESVSASPKVLKGRFVNLFDSELMLQRSIVLEPGKRVFLLDLDAVKSSKPHLLASGCKALLTKREGNRMTWTVEGIDDTPAILLVSSMKPPHSVQLDQQALDSYAFNHAEGLLFVRFVNQSRPRELVIEF
jgi:hypothetical protein